jgi:HAD superfamily hydrolase (TIGR01509 family)
VPSPIRALFLDFDGTLVDSEGLHYDCWLETIRPYGGYIDWPDYCRRMVGISDRQAGEVLLAEAGHEPTEQAVDEACTHKKTLYRARFVEELSIEDGILEWLQNRLENLHLGVVSSSLTPEVEPLLIRQKIRETLDILICGEHVERRKPHPEPYLLALKLVNDLNGRGSAPPIEAADCLVVEDSDAGVASARAAGLRLRRVQSPAELPQALAEATGEPLKSDE